MSTFSSSAIITKARQYIGTPFVIGGRTKWGLDCAGLLLISAYGCGAEDAEPEAYGRIFSYELMLAGLQNLGNKLTDGQIVHAGDILLFNILGSSQHLAMVTESDVSEGPVSMIHSYETVGKVVEHNIDKHWRSRIESVWRWKEAQWT